MSVGDSECFRVCLTCPCDLCRLTATQDLAPFFEPFDIPMSPKLLETGGPLMGVVVVPLVDGLACLKVSICHLLTDGSAYYMVLKQLDDACHGRSFAPLT